MASDIPPPLPPRARAAAASVDRRTSRLAVASVVLGVLTCPLSCLAGIPGVICGVLGLRQVERSERPGSPVRYTGRTAALVGIVLNAVMLPFSIGLLLPAVQSAREAARRAACGNNGRVIGLALRQAAAASRSGMMPLAIVDGEGRPLLSWRVAVLPYLGEEKLYREFHLDEPWDSPHNRSLLPRMPQVYACPSQPRSTAGTTSWLAAAGPGMAFDGPEAIPGTSLIGVPPSVVRDGAGTTILVMEMGPSDLVPWTSPREIMAGADQVGDIIGGTQSNHLGGLRPTVFADGSVRAVRTELAPQALRGLFTRAGGEPGPEF